MHLIRSARLVDLFSIVYINHGEGAMTTEGKVDKKNVR